MRRAMEIAYVKFVTLQWLHILGTQAAVKLPAVIYRAYRTNMLDALQKYALLWEPSLLCAGMHGQDT